MRPFWTRRAVELLPEPVGSRPEGKTIHVKPPAEPNPDTQPELNDAERANMWKGLAESRRAKMDDLRAEIDRLRADLALAEHARRRLVECGHEQTLRRYDHDRRVCQREHVDEIDRLNALVVRLRAAAVTREWGPF